MLLLLGMGEGTIGGIEEEVVVVVVGGVEEVVVVVLAAVVEGVLIIDHEKIIDGKRGTKGINPKVDEVGVGEHMEMVDFLRMVRSKKKLLMGAKKKRITFFYHASYLGVV